jgi:predicted dehydrogenase
VAHAESGLEASHCSRGSRSWNLARTSRAGDRDLLLETGAAVAWPADGANDKRRPACCGLPSQPVCKNRFSAEFLPGGAMNLGCEGNAARSSASTSVYGHRRGRDLRASLGWCFLSDLLERFGRRIRLGMVGGGSDSVIGSVHRIALRADGMCELVAGAMSIDPEIAVASAQAELLDPARTYTDFRTMASTEAERSDRIDAVIVATPPQTHYDVATCFLDHGIDVICEKPMTRTAAESVLLVEKVEQSGRLFLLTHCYTGYPMIRHARELVAAGTLGRINLIEAEFASGSLAREPADPTSRHWRFRSESMGPAAILGEVGTHTHHLAMYVAGVDATAVSARLDTFATGREVYDNAYLTMTFANGAVGRLWNSYVAIGNEHGLSLRIFGEEGSLFWHQEDAEVLWHKPFRAPPRRLTRGSSSLDPSSPSASRFPSGHPEGYALAFANLYRNFACSLICRELGEPFHRYMEPLPNVYDGLATMRLFEASEASQESGGAWQSVPPTARPTTGSWAGARAD